MNKDPLFDEWHPILDSEDIPEGQLRSASLLGHDLVLWRGEKGVHAWPDLCLHRGARLSIGKVQGNCLCCPYHGWVYSEEGRCVKIPAHPRVIPPSRAHITPFLSIENYGVVWVSLGTPQGDPFYFPEWKDLSVGKTRTGPYRLNASVPRVLENFLDLAHLPIVHEGILGDLRQADIPDYHVQKRPGGGWLATDIRLWQPDPDGSGQPQIVSYTYEIIRPLVARFQKTGNGKKYGIYASVQPINPRESVLWMWNFWYPQDNLTPEGIRIHQERIVAQDRLVVESQRPELLPLDLAAELHLPSDRLSIVYRRWLRELGVSFGTS